jgi:hypothetical protein
MPTSKDEKPGGQKSPQDDSQKQSVNRPDEDSIISEEEFTSPVTGKKYTIIRTNERDAYEEDSKSGDESKGSGSQERSK